MTQLFMLDPIQQRQEDDYIIPYHWFKRPENVSGRIYFGYMSICEQILSALSGGRKDALRILDAGCGDGRFIGLLSEMGYTQTWGTDFSERALAFAKLLAPQVTFQQGDLMTSLPFEDGFFDVIFFIETLEHIPPADIPTVIRNLRRVIKPTGTLIVTVPSVLQDMAIDGKHYQHFSDTSLRTTLGPAFTVTEMRGQNTQRFSPLKLVYFLLDNPYWTIPQLLEWYNLKVWPKRFNACDAADGRRLIAIAHPQ